MIVSETGAGVKPAQKRTLKKTAQAVVPVAACRAKCTRRGWWIDQVIGYTVTEQGKAALMESKQPVDPMKTALTRLAAHYPLVRMEGDDNPFGPCLRFKGPGQESVVVTLSMDGTLNECADGVHFYGRRLFFCDLDGPMTEPVFARRVFREAARRFLAGHQAVSDALDATIDHLREQVTCPDCAGTGHEGHPNTDASCGFCWGIGTISRLSARGPKGQVAA